MDETRYDLKELQTKPILSENAGTKEIYENFLQLTYCLGWQCTYGINFCILDDENITFGAGTSIVILKLSTGQQTILPTVCGTGIAHIILHPNCTMFAVAEKGHNGTIDIFAYPSLSLCKLLRGDNESSYVCMDYNPNGKLLASLTSEPEFNVTIWYWETESILLRAKAFSQEVKDIKFSKFTDGVLITGGVGHIKFWSISRTFTGLKLKGQIGKYGYTDVSDVCSFVQLPDGKVVSSSDWGNLLVWESNMIQIQITRTGGKPCHDGKIYQITLEESELYTVGSDSYIRVWDIESIEMIYPEEEQGLYEIKPLGEIHVNPGADLRCIFLSPSKLNKLWYAQDAKGAIWKIDLSLDITAKLPEIIKTFPGLKITGCEMCPMCHLLAVTSKDCIVRLYSCLNNSLVMSCQYDAPVTALLWGPMTLDKEGGSLFLGFEDGVVRWVVIKEGQKRSAKKYHLLLHNAVKSHNAEVTCMKINNIATYLVSSSLDGKVFFYFMRGGDMKPIGFVDVFHPVEWILWLEKVDLILVGNNSHFLAALETTKNVAAKGGMNTYKLTDLYWCIITLKLPLDEKSVSGSSSEFINLDTLDAEEDNPVVETSIQVKNNLEDSNDEQVENEQVEGTEQTAGEIDDSRHRVEETVNEEPPSIVPETEIGQDEIDVNMQIVEDEKTEKGMKEDYEAVTDMYYYTVTSALYTGVSGKFWVSLKTDNPGVIYEYDITKDMVSESSVALDAIRQIQLPFPNPQPITCMKFSLYKNYLLAGQSDGILIVYALGKHDSGIQFSDFFSYKILDSEIGAIMHMSLTFDGKFLAVASKDGNIILLKVNAPREDRGEALPKVVRPPSSHYLATTRDADGKGDSLEETCKAALEIQVKKNLEKKHHHLINQMALLRSKVGKLNEVNSILPSHMQVCLEEYAVHEKIKERLEDEMKISAEQIRKRFEHDIKYNNILMEKLDKKYKESIATEFFSVTAFLSEEKVHTYKIVNFPFEKYMEVDYSDIESLKKLQSMQQHKEEDSKTLDMFDNISLFKFSDFVQINDVSKLSDEEIQEKLVKHVGDYKLKTSSQYLPLEYVPMQSILKQIQLLQLNLQIHEMKKKFNDRFFELEQQKQQILKTMSNVNMFTTNESNNCVFSNEGRRNLVKMQTSLHSHICNLSLSVCPWQIDSRFVAMPAVIQEAFPEKSSSSSFFSSVSWKASRMYFSFSHTGSLQTDKKYMPSQTRTFKSSLYLSNKLNEISKIRESYEEKNVHYKTLIDVWAFDIRIHFLKLYRYFMEFELKQAEFKCLIYLQELQIFRKYDEERNLLIAQWTTKVKQNSEIEAKMEKQLEIIAQQQNYLGSLYAEEEMNYNTLPTILGENNKNAKLLTKFFKKKIKWGEVQKYVRGGADSEVNHDEDDDEEESDWSSDEEDSCDYNKEWDCKSCPADCDTETFEAVSKLRQNRSIIEYKIREIKQLIETHKKVHDILEKKGKLIEESVVPLQNRLEGIQLMKQKELNEIYHTVYLRIGQIVHCMPPMPAKLEQCVIFQSKQKSILEKRLDILSKHTNQTTQVSKDVQARESELKKECYLLNKNVQKLKEVAKLRMIQKFGQVVDLQELKNVENPAWLIELKNKQKQQTWNYAKAMKVRREKLAQREKIYMEVMKERSTNLLTLTALKAEWLKLHTSLSKRKAFTFQVKNL